MPRFRGVPIHGAVCCWPVQVLTIGKISSAVVLAGAAYQDEAGYARMTGLQPERTRLLDDKGRTDTQACASHGSSGLCRDPLLGGFHSLLGVVIKGAIALWPDPLGALWSKGALVCAGACVMDR